MGEVKLKKDIVKEVAEEMGLNPTVVSNVVDSSIEYFHHAIENNKDLLSVNIMHLCTFNANYSMLRAAKNKHAICYDRLTLLKNYRATSKHIDIPLHFMAYRRNCHKIDSKKRVEEGLPVAMPPLYWAYDSYYRWVKRIEEVNNEKVEKYFK